MTGGRHPMIEGDLHSDWFAAEDAMPDGWRLAALVHTTIARMAVGLHPVLEEDLRTVDTDLTSDGWVALAAGAGSDWVVGTGSDPGTALRDLTGRLRARTADRS